MTKISIYQIYYSDETKAQLDPGFIPLDNMANERPDWREYWPIRKFLLANELHDDELYGFLSPKFYQKTRLRSSDVYNFISSQKEKFDVYLFSPMADVSSFYLNLFESGDIAHPGLMEISQAFFKAMNIPIALKELVTDSNTACFCNYFVANKKVWRIWFDLAEKLFAICEDPGHPLKDALNRGTSHDSEAAMKVFLAERLISVILNLHKQIQVRPFFPLALPPINSALSKYPTQAVICDALKMAYQAQGYGEYLALFDQVRREVFEEVRKADAT